MDKPKGIGAWKYSSNHSTRQSFRQFSNTLRESNASNADPEDLGDLMLDGADVVETGKTLICSEKLFVDVRLEGGSPLYNNLKYIIFAGKKGNVDHLLIVSLDHISRENEWIIRNILESGSEKIFKDAKPGLTALMNSGYRVNGKIFDISLAEKVIRSGEITDLTFSELAKKYLKLDIIDDFRWGNDLTKENIDGMIYGVGIAFRIKRIIEGRLKELNLVETAELEFECVPALVELELAGIGFDYQRWAKNKDAAALRRNKALEKWKDSFPNIDVNDEEKVLAELQLKGINIPNLNKAEVIKFKQHPEIKVIHDCKEAINLEALLTRNIAKFISPSTKRLEPTYHQIGTATGRITCSSPNLQSIPRIKELRECFVPSPGYKFIISDYSQIELRVAAEISKDPVMIKAFKEGKDLHRFTAANIAGKAYDAVTKEERQAAKAVNFGLIYAMGVEGLMKYAEASYGVQLTIEEASKFRVNFFNTYKGIKQWQDKISSDRIAESRTLNNRRRLWAEAPKITQLYNSPVQGTGADIMKKALAILAQKMEGTLINMVGVVHDEIIIEAPENECKEAQEILVNSMKRGGEVFLKKIPLEVEVRIADSWAG